MPVLPNPEHTRFDDIIVVQAKGHNRSATGGRQPDDSNAAVFPLEMGFPALGARIVKGDERLCDGVRRVGAGAFVLVTAVARSTKIIQCVGAAYSSGRDMINHQGHGNQTSGRPAILAKLTSPGKNLGAQGRWERRHCQCTGMASRAGIG